MLPHDVISWRVNLLPSKYVSLTHWNLLAPSDMTWMVIASGNGLSPVRRQAIAWHNVGILSTGPWEQFAAKFWIKISVSASHVYWSISTVWEDKPIKSNKSTGSPSLSCTVTKYICGWICLMGHYNHECVSMVVVDARRLCGFGASSTTNMTQVCRYKSRTLERNDL